MSIEKNRATSSQILGLPKEIFIAAILYFGIALFIHFWRGLSLSYTYDQALFTQELWSSFQGNIFSSSLSSELSAAVKVLGQYPNIDYQHIGQHSNILTVVFGAPLIGLIGPIGLPLLHVGLITFAGTILWRIAAKRLNKELSTKIVLAYYLSGTVIGPTLENFHDFCWIPLLGFLVIEAFLESNSRNIIIFSLLFLLAREDSGLTLFSIGLWASLRRTNQRPQGFIVMAISFIYMSLMTGVIQPIFDTSVADRFMQEKFSHILQGQEGGPTTLLWIMISHPDRVLKALIFPPLKTIGFIIFPAVPLALIPLISWDVFLMVSVPLFVALISQGMSALSVTLRYVMVLVPGLFVGTILFLESNPKLFRNLIFKYIWTTLIGLGFLLTILSNPYRSLSAVIPDSFSPWVHVSPIQMIKRGRIAREASKEIPSNASVAADTPLLPIIAQRKALLRFPENINYLNKKKDLEAVEWIFAFPDYYLPFIPLFTEETNRWKNIIRKLNELIDSPDYGIAYCKDGAVILKKGAESKEEGITCYKKIAKGVEKRKKD